MFEKDAFDAGFSDCEEEAVRFLMSTQDIAHDHPLVTGLRCHLKRKYSDCFSTQDLTDLQLSKKLKSHEKVKKNNKTVSHIWQYAQDLRLEDSHFDDAADEGYTSLINNVINLTENETNSKPHSNTSIGDLCSCSGTNEALEPGDYNCNNCCDCTVNASQNYFYEYECAVKTAKPSDDCEDCKANAMPSNDHGIWAASTSKPDDGHGYTINVLIPGANRYE